MCAQLTHDLFAIAKLLLDIYIPPRRPGTSVYCKNIANIFAGIFPISLVRDYAWKIAISDRSMVVSRIRFNIDLKLLYISNMKSHSTFRLAILMMTLDDREQSCQRKLTVRGVIARKLFVCCSTTAQRSDESMQPRSLYRNARLSYKTACPL